MRSLWASVLCAFIVVASFLRADAFTVPVQGFNFQEGVASPSVTINFLHPTVASNLEVLQIALHQGALDDSISLPAGWTVVAGPTSGLYRVWGAYKTASAGETSVVVTFTGSSPNSTGNLFFTEYSNPGTFINSFTTTETQLSTANFTVPLSSAYGLVSVTWYCLPTSSCTFNSVMNWEENMPEFAAAGLGKAEGQQLFLPYGANPISSVSLGGTGTTQLAVALAWGPGANTSNPVFFGPY